MAKYFKQLNNDQFSTFEGNLVTEVTTNAVAWNIPAGAVTALTTAQGVYQPLWNAAKVKSNRTPLQTKQHQTGRVVYEDFIEGFANMYLVGNQLITDDVLEALGFNRKPDELTPRPKITAEVFAKVEANAIGSMEFMCRTNTDASRCSIAKDADGVEVVFIVGTVPTTHKDCTKSFISTKARFTLDMEPEDAGKKLYGFLRWVNIKNPKNNGPWTDMFGTLIR